MAFLKTFKNVICYLRIRAERQMRAVVFDGSDRDKEGDVFALGFLKLLGICVFKSHGLDPFRIISMLIIPSFSPSVNGGKKQKVGEN